MSTPLRAWAEATLRAKEGETEGPLLDRMVVAQVNEARLTVGDLRAFLAEETTPLQMDDEAISAWFELTYAQYLTVPRSILEAMPAGWQARMAECLQELDETFDWRPKEGRYWCRLKDGNGRFVDDPLMNYRRPQRDYIESLRRKPAP